MLFDLIDEDDGVADDHAKEREDAEIRDESNGGVREQHREHDADEPERRGEDGQGHLAHAADLDHEECHDDENHSGHGLHEVTHRVRGVRERACRLDGRPYGEPVAQLLGRGENAARGVVAFALRDLRLHEDGGTQIEPLDEAVLRLVGNMRNLRERDVPAGRGDGELPEPLDIRPIWLCKPQSDADRAIARVELRRLSARELGVEHLLDSLGSDAETFQFFLVKIDADSFRFLRPVEVYVRGRGIAARDRSDLLGNAPCFVRGGGGDAQHDGEVGRRPRLDVLRRDACARELVTACVSDQRGKLLAFRRALRRDDELRRVVGVRLRIDGEDEPWRRPADVVRVVFDFVHMRVEDRRKPIRLCLRRLHGRACGQG